MSDPSACGPYKNRQQVGVYSLPTPGLKVKGFLEVVLNLEKVLSRFFFQSLAPKCNLPQESSLQTERRELLHEPMVQEGRF